MGIKPKDASRWKSPGLRKVEPPKAPVSWWTEHPSAKGFTARAEDEQERMRASSFGMPEQRRATE